MKRILIIEDENSVRTILSDMLSEKGYKTINASDGREGIQLAKQTLPDLIISDIMMPEVDGYSVKAELFKCKSTLHIPFIFLTAKADICDMRIGMELGADDYISKPFRAADIIKAVEVRINKYESLRNYFREGKNPEVQNPEVINPEVINPEVINPEVQNPDKYDISDFMFLGLNNKAQFLKIREIACITAKNEYSEIYTITGHRFLLRKSLSKWENILPGNSFIRIHRATIINIEHIEKMEKYSSRTIKVWLKCIRKEVIVSQRYASKLKMQIHR